MKLIDYSISTSSDIEALKSKLTQCFTALKETAEQMTVDIYDTFDWRLHHNGWQLLRHADNYKIIHAATGRLISDIVVDGKKARPFSWDFPASAFADKLGPVIEMRALIPLATIEKTVNHLALCNTDDKTVARLEFESLAVKGNAHTAARCRLLPVRGYGKDSRKVMEILEDLKLEPSTVSPVVDVLQQCGAQPGAYSSKVNVTLSAQMPAAMAVQRILKNLTTVMHQNLDGVRKDIDSEFLHDFRVAVRRARSLLGQTKGVLSPETTTALQTHLKTMGGITGDVRDLDVYLLKKTTYVDYVPDVLKPGVQHLFRILQRKRRTAKDRMGKAMVGDEFKAALDALDAFVGSDPLAHTDAAGNLPIGELAKTAINKRYRRILKKGRRITSSTADEKLHELRIDCKKLRYLLEFFTSLFPADQMKILIKQLKRLQDNLGDFNDLCVQQDFLTVHLETIKPQTPQAVILAAATGGLITRLVIEQGRVRSDFLSVFEVFSSHENKARFKRLFT